VRSFALHQGNHQLQLIGFARTSGVSLRRYVRINNSP
jgi:hypothetical protein